MRLIIAYETKPRRPWVYARTADIEEGVSPHHVFMVDKGLLNGARVQGDEFEIEVTPAELVMARARGEMIRAEGP